MPRSRLAQQAARFLGSSRISNPPTPKTPERDLVLSYATELLGRSREEIDRADAKASILLAASGVAIGALLAGLLAGTWTPLRIGAAVQWLWWAGAVAAAIGVWCLAWAVYPRKGRRPKAGWAIGYYGDVLAYDTAEELISALHGSAHSNINRVADQLRQVSRIVHRKYELIRWGMRLQFLAATAVMVSVSVNYLLR